MRLTRSMWSMTLIAAAACSNSLTAPPHGLPVTLTVVTTLNVQVPSIAAADDSVTAVVIEPGNEACGSGLPTVDAGLRSDDLVVTLSQPAIQRQCPPGAGTAVNPLPFSIVVHDVPSGTRAVRVELRVISGDKASFTELASGTISLP